MFRISPASATGMRGLFRGGAYLIFGLTSAGIIWGQGLFGGGLNQVNTVCGLKNKGLPFELTSLPSNLFCDSCTISSKSGVSGVRK